MTQESLIRTNAFNAGKRQNREDLHNFDKSGQSYFKAICLGNVLACEWQKFSSLIAAERRFARRNVCDLATEIPY